MNAIRLKPIKETIVEVPRKNHNLVIRSSSPDKRSVKKESVSTEVNSAVNIKDPLKAINHTIQLGSKQILVNEIKKEDKLLDYTSERIQGSVKQQMNTKKTSEKLNMLGRSSRKDNLKVPKYNIESLAKSVDSDIRLYILINQTYKKTYWRAIVQLLIQESNTEDTLLNICNPPLFVP